MRDLLKKLRKHSFPVHVVAFLAMILPSASLYFLVGSGGVGWVWGLLGVVLLANLLAMLV
ncbi:MAG: hypothetical protein R6U57_03430 [Anaerolineales bacterium]